MVYNLQRVLRILVPITGFIVGISADNTWCGKHYKASDPPIHPGGQFPVPSTSSTASLAFHCSPAIKPYLAEDANTPSSDVAILIGTLVTFRNIPNAVPIPDHSTPGLLNVSVSVDGNALCSGTVPLNATKEALPFSLSSLQPRAEAYNITCSATLNSQKFEATSSLTYLPDPPSNIGSVTKMDLRTGALLARPANGKGPYAPVIPMGFYTNFDGYLEQNLSIPAELQAQGFNVVHPIPTFENLTRLDEVLDKIQDAGLYLIYDMRLDYMNTSAVTAQVKHIQSRPNLLAWYTADEPDGTSDPVNATLNAYNTITSLDGGDGKGGQGYHPVSLVLNCENYFFTDYANGADIVAQDTYMIGNNATFSSQWGTKCTPEFGDCGCDNCQGSFQDISTRMDEFSDRLFINAWELSKVVWAVPQAFGKETYWKRTPTGPEFVVETIIAINHGAVGVIAWNDPTTPDIKAYASRLALSMPNMTRFILNATSVVYRHSTFQGVDIGLWECPDTSETLVLATNTNYHSVSMKITNLGLPSPTIKVVEQVFDTGINYNATDSTILFLSVGSGGFIITTG